MSRLTEDPREDSGEGTPRPPQTDTVRVYFDRIKNIPLLGPEEEKRLSRRIARGDSEARKKMIESNLRLVVNIAKRYIGRGLPFQDVIEEGNIGLMKSVERFKASKNCRFSTYATYWIRQSIERAIVNQSGVVRYPIHVTADLNRITRATRELSMLLGRDPTARELSDRTGLSGRYLKKLDAVRRKSLSIESPYPESDQPFLERLEDDTFPGPLELLEKARTSENVDRWLSVLDDDERDVIRLRFGLGRQPRTLEAIGRTYGVTRERIRQIEAKALEKLRKIIGETSPDLV